MFFVYKTTKKSNKKKVTNWTIEFNRHTIRAQWWTMALKKVKGNFERMFDKNLTDLVRGIRNNKDNEVIIN